MMEKNLFKQKYLGELTLKNGTHVRYLYPITRKQVYTHCIAAKQLYDTIQKYRDSKTKYWWVLFDDLSLVQFQIVYAAIKIYGDNYWKLLWENRLKKS